MCVGVATDTIAVTETQNVLAAKPKPTSTSGPVRTRKQSVVMCLLMLVCRISDGVQSVQKRGDLKETHGDFKGCEKTTTLETTTE